MWGWLIWKHNPLKCQLLISTSKNITIWISWFVSDTKYQNGKCCVLRIFSVMISVTMNNWNWVGKCSPLVFLETLLYQVMGVAKFCHGKLVMANHTLHQFSWEGVTHSHLELQTKPLSVMNFSQFLVEVWVRPMLGILSAWPPSQHLVWCVTVYHLYLYSYV